MKSFTSHYLFFARTRASQRNLLRLTRFLLVLIGMITAYSIGFHYLMALEGRDYSWVTGIYWTLTVMSTTGFGDITFTSDAGKIFSLIVLVSGTLFLLVLLPFTFIQFFYQPWMEAQTAARAPRKVPDDMKDHVILTEYSAVTTAVIQRLEQYRHQYVVVVPEIEEALRLHDQGVAVCVGDLDDPDTFERVRVRKAALLATTRSDVSNTGIAFLARGMSEELPIIATASEAASVDVLKLAGSNHVLRLSEQMGQWLARRTVGGDAVTHVIGEFGPLLIAEATAMRTPLAGKTLREHGLREKVGVSVVGVWERGQFRPADGETRITHNTILVLAGSRAQLDFYDELFCIYNVSTAPVVVIGGGAVGEATGRALEEREIDYRIVEQVPELITDTERLVLGSAGDLEVLERANIREAPAVIITPHDDDLNVYLTIYCRRLRPDIQIITRASHERSVPTMHRAGADLVISYSSMAANMIINLLKHSEVVMVAEGVDVFKVKVPSGLADRTIKESGIREATGCSVVSLGSNGAIEINPDPKTRLAAGAEIVLVGSVEAEERFLELYGEA